MFPEGKLPEERLICHLDAEYDRKSAWSFLSLCSHLCPQTLWQPGNSQGLFLCLSLCCPDERWVLFNLAVPSGFLWRFPAYPHKWVQKCLRKWQFPGQPHSTISSINQEETKEENGKQMLWTGQGYEWLMPSKRQGEFTPGDTPAWGWGNFLCKAHYCKMMAGSQEWLPRWMSGPAFRKLCGTLQTYSQVGSERHIKTQGEMEQELHASLPYHTWWFSC